MNVRGALLDKGWGLNNDVLICYMDFVWSRSQRQHFASLTWCVRVCSIQCMCLSHELLHACQTALVLFLLYFYV